MCRVPRIRRLAISRPKAVEKSSWNCEHCALIAQYLLETEETGLGTITHCEEILSEKRIRRIMTEVCFEEAHNKLTYVWNSYSQETSINVAILPLKQPGGIVSTYGSVELNPITPNKASSSSATEADSE